MNLTKSISLNEIRQYKPSILLKLAQEIGAELDGVRQKDIITAVLKKSIDSNKHIEVQGILDIVNENYGFLRFQSESYVNSNEDVFVSGNLMKKLNLKTGDTIKGYMKLPANTAEKHYTLHEVISVNNEDPSKCKIRNSFESMTALYPSRKINLEYTGDKLGIMSLRVMDFMVPIGFGQRALIVAPPKTGKTTLMQNIAHAILANHPEAYLMILLIGERPEEVTDMRRSVTGAEVVSSTFDEPPSQHVHVAEITLAKAKRLAELGKDVILLMDSLTRFARANNTAMPSSGKVLTGGIDSNALQKPKQFFGAARDLEGAGSLTIIATTLVDTGSKADEVIHEEFKGTGNAEIVLERKIAEKKIFPAIDIIKSGTRKEELLLEQRVLSLTYLLRRILSTMGSLEATEFLLSKMSKTRNNKEFFITLNKTSEDM